MALKPCSECDHRVSTLAFTCPNCGAPVDAPAAGPAHAPAGRREGASAPARSHRAPWLLLGGLAMAVLGGLADAAVRHLKSRPAASAAAMQSRSGIATDSAGPARVRRSGASVAGDRIGEMTAQLPGVGLPHRFAAEAIDSLRGLHMDEGARNAEIDLRLTLADVASQEEMDVAAYGSYTRTLRGLGVVPRKGVHVDVSAGDGSWTASATHDRLPGIVCTTSAGDGQEVHPGQVTCTGGAR